MIDHIGVVVKSTGSLYLVRVQNGTIYQCRIKGKLRIAGIRSTNPVAVGDIVEFEVDPNEFNDRNLMLGIIKLVKERKNYIIRKSINLSKEIHILAANIDQALLVVTLIKPITTTIFIDRILASAEAYNIPVTIVFNKIDLLSKIEMDQINEYYEIYNKIGYQCIGTSTITKQGIVNLRLLMKDKVNMIIGHSGVGKSSLINLLDQELKLKTGEISSVHQQGKHITTFSEMFQLSFGGYIIDTPGIRGFGMIDMYKEEISHFFREIFLIGKDCKFYNCSHTHEPGCSVIDSVKKGTISLSRYESYLNIINEDEEKYRAAF
jgi:ribosome biogenesis GTPase / thiamine phosphate phosphatase